jgi:hypothetical protein
MQTNDDRSVELIELGSVTGDTAGGQLAIPEGFTGMVKSGITAD